MALPDTSSNPTWDDYTPVALTACMRALGSLVMAMSAQDEPRLVVVGGLVPNLLFQNNSDEPLIEADPHPGTNDVDFCVQLDVPGDDDVLYQNLLGVLKDHGFVRMQQRTQSGDPAESVWQWTLTVDDVRVAVEFLSPPDSLMAGRTTPVPGRLTQGEKIRSGDEIGALRIRGADLAHADPTPVTINIELLGDRGRMDVQVWVANILPFVVLKSFAIRGRGKDKDAFDLIWLLMNWPGGPDSAARAARLSPVVNRPDVEIGLGYLREAFSDIGQHGCVRYAKFRMSSGQFGDSDETRVRYCRDAQGAVHRFLREWDGANRHR